MNLKGVYEIFYPGRDSNQISVWCEKPIYRSKIEFFEALFPVEVVGLNTKLWNDKSRRSRFLSDGKKESTYLALLKERIITYPLTIPRMEKKGTLIFGDKISAEAMEQVFREIIERENIVLSSILEKHLLDTESGKIKPQWGNVAAFLVLYAIFPAEVNQLYFPYLYQKENEFLLSDEREKKDYSLFLSEYPPDMGVFYPGEEITHTWILKNAGEIPWKDRYLECDAVHFDIGEENRKINMPEIVYPGDTISPTVRFRAPDTPGAYMINWKMKDCNGKMLYLDRLGIQIHFTILEEPVEDKEMKDSNYRVLEETPRIPALLKKGERYSHTWTIKNTGSTTWKNYYCECINGEPLQYVRSELRIPLKSQVEPGESISLQVEFIAPPLEGCVRFIWKIMREDGTPAFPKGRQLEVLLNVI